LFRIYPKKRKKKKNEKLKKKVYFSFVFFEPVNHGLDLKTLFTKVSVAPTKGATYYQINEACVERKLEILTKLTILEQIMEKLIDKREPREMIEM